MALIKLNNQSLTAVSALPAMDGSNLTGVSAGKVLQVIQQTSGVGVSQNNTTAEADVNPTITITPSSTNSKILVMHSAGGMVTTVDGVGFKLYRGTTSIWFQSRWGYSDTNTWKPVPFVMQFLDTPATTSAITYKWAIYAATANGLLWHNNSGTAMSIAMEIAG